MGWPKPILFHKRRIIQSDYKDLSQLAIKTIEEVNLIYNSFGMPITVAFSGGKDSVVLLDIIARANIPYESRYYVTTVDPPELVHFIRNNFPQVIFDKPKYSMLQLIKKRQIAPTRYIRFCCDVLKERKHKGITIVGVRSEESFKRKYRNKLVVFSKNRVLYSPLLEWNESHIWEYIEENKLPYCKLYDEEGVHRIGCVGCPLVVKRVREREFIRWPMYKKLYITAFDYIVKNTTLPIKGRRFNSGQEMFDWWMNQ